MVGRTLDPPARSLQEWMERTGTSSVELVRLVRQQTGHSISLTMMSFILRRSRRCSALNALALSTVTGIPIKTLRRWKGSKFDNISVRRSKDAA